MLDYIKKLITPDMVSLWVPSGQKRAQDLIRGNHGQCYGTHPNVPVISKLVEPELVANGGFDSDTTSWAAAASAILASVLGGQSGNCLRVTEGGEIHPNTFQDVSVVAGKLYEGSIWVKKGTEATFRWRLRDQDNATDIFYSADAEAGTGWGRHAHSFTAPVGCTTVRVVVYQRCGAGAGTNIYFDSISIKELKPSLINPSVGWHFDGVNDYIDLGSDINIGKVHTSSCWFSIDDSATGTYRSLMGDDNGYATPLMIRLETKLLYYHEGVNSAYVAWTGYERAVWHCFSTVRNGTSVDFFIDAIKVGSTQTLASNGDVDIHTLGDRNGDTKWYGFLAFPFIANTAWSVAQVNNFYLQTKGMFAPRG